MYGKSKAVRGIGGRIGVIALLACCAWMASVAGALGAANTTLPPVLAFFPFEGNAQDASGNGRHGTVSGATLAVGYEGQAYSFNGTSSYIEVPLDISPSKYPQLSMGAWVRAASPSNPRRQVLSHDDGGFDRSLGIEDSGWGLFCGSGGVLCGDPVVEGKMVFLAAVYDQAAGTAKLWVDDKSYTKTSVTLGDGNTKLRIGSNPGGANTFPALSTTSSSLTGP
ncbi:MAG: LamG domain-containing protein [Deltaproteobacteria bacterium]|nr:LamG domain-containing protein [Deltaproteobacteria bacterium]